MDERNYAGTITVKVGPVTANYRGKMRFERLDTAARGGEIVASGQESRGKGGADMRMKSRVVEHAPGETEVTVVSEVNVSGHPGPVRPRHDPGRSDQLFQKFTDGMRRELETPAPRRRRLGTRRFRDVRYPRHAAPLPPHRRPAHRRRSRRSAGRPPSAPRCAAAGRAPAAAQSRFLDRWPFS